MSNKPILFSGPMVRAILEGRKTMTRRVVKPQPPGWIDDFGFNCFTPKGSISGRGYYEGELAEKFIKMPYHPRDILWVRETWALAHFSTDEYDHIDAIEEYEGPIPKEKPDKYWSVAYNANFDDIRHDQDDRLIKKWRPSIFMPRWASRVTLEVTGVRAERLQEITEEDARREGAEWLSGTPINGTNYVRSFSDLWDSINGKEYPWSSNPWVWVIEFRRIDG
ncbi:MAG: hypothetical protein ACYDHW_06630 [Syntrophorhabdaceae bacterium]